MSEQQPQQPAPRVLIVDRDPYVVDSLSRLLEQAGYRPSTAPDADQAMTMLRDTRDKPPAERFRLMIAEINLPNSGGMELLRHVREHHPSVVTIVVTGYGTIESAVEAVKLGAFEYLTKPIVDEELELTAAKALRQQTLLQENEDLRDQLTGRKGLDRIVGRDPRMQRVYELIEAVAPTDTTVLVSGPSGTGKTMVAEAIHDHSPRHAGPMVEFACGSIPETLLESELFGHVKGAFTGADADKPGKLDAAEGGTLFIDEINSATPALQLKLLRVMQHKRFEPVGSQQTKQADVRFVVATNEPLEQMVRDGTFREDLYYRINVVNIQVPPLRERTADIVLLADHFLRLHAHQAGRTITGFSDEARQALVRYRWPGNVRELANAVERAVVLAGRPVIELDDLPDSIRFQEDDGSPGFRERRRNPWGADPHRPPKPLRHALREPERQIILAALQYHGWNRQQTAADLDINRTTLYKKIKQYGLETLHAV